MRRLRKFWSLTRREKTSVCEAGFLRLLSSLCIRVLAFRHIERCLRARWSEAGLGEPDRGEAIGLVELSVSRAARLLPWDCRCLCRAIATYIMLRRRGVPAILLAGARMSEDAALDAHAWVQTGGAETSTGSEHAPFAELLRIGAGPVDR
jgi:hypothetical protein